MRSNKKFLKMVTYTNYHYQSIINNVKAIEILSD